MHFWADFSCQPSGWIRLVLNFLQASEGVWGAVQASSVRYWRSRWTSLAIHLPTLAPVGPHVERYTPIIFSSGGLSPIDTQMQGWVPICSLSSSTLRVGLPLRCLLVVPLAFSWCLWKRQTLLHMRRCVKQQQSSGCVYLWWPFMKTRIYAAPMGSIFLAFLYMWYTW